MADQTASDGYSWGDVWTGIQSVIGTGAVAGTANAVNDFLSPPASAPAPSGLVSSGGGGLSLMSIVIIAGIAWLALRKT